MSNKYPPLVSVAPMLDVTDKWERYLLRLITKCTTLFTEMVVDTTVIYLQKKSLDFILDYNKVEHPIVIQLGGCQPKTMACASQIVEKWNYDEININCGCPSNKVSKNDFGAKLMLNPELVADIVKSMKEKVKTKVTIKCRIGVDQKDSYEDLKTFITTTNQAGCDEYIIHARKCWLKGLSTSENRTIPELNYNWVFQLLDDFPQCEFILNGGIETIEQVQQLLSQQSPQLKRCLKGVMLGRSVMHNPWLLRHVDQLIYKETDLNYHRMKILYEYVQYYNKLRIHYGERIGSDNIAIKPLMYLFGDEKGSVPYRRTLQECISKHYSLKNAIAHAIRSLSTITLFTMDNKQEELEGKEEEIRFYREYFTPIDPLEDTEDSHEHWNTEKVLYDELEYGYNNGFVPDFSCLMNDEKGEKKRRERQYKKNSLIGARIEEQESTSETIHE